MDIGSLLLSLPKTLWINYRYLPFKQAIKLPIWIKYRSRIHSTGGGKIIIESCKVSFAMIRIGFHQVPVCNCNDKTVIEIKSKGCLKFLGTAHIGNGSKLHVAENAYLILGDNFAISASSSINCYKKIVMGRDIQFSWNCLVMDSDTHFILDENGKLMNEDKPIIMGDKIWVGCNTTILKGTTIPSNCVIGANSFVSGNKFNKSTIILGAPAKSIKTIGTWEL